MTSEEGDIIGVRINVLGHEDSQSFSFDTGPGAPPMMLIRGAAREPGDRSRVDAYLDMHVQWPGVVDVHALADALEEVAQMLRDGVEDE